MIVGWLLGTRSARAELAQTDRNGRIRALDLKGDLVEIRSGLAGGERAIVDPPARLRDGMKVKVAGE